MERQQVVDWVDGYVAAWESNDPERITALFTDDAEYRYHAYEEPVRGARAIADSWLEEPDEPGTWQADYRPVAVDGDTAVVVGTSRYQATGRKPERTYHNCFVLRFAADGRCREFTEWYVREPD